MAILRSTSERDIYRIGLLSAASKWSQTQWGTNAVIDGNFGQGLLSKESSFDQFSNSILGSGQVKIGRMPILFSRNIEMKS